MIKHKDPKHPFYDVNIYRHQEQAYIEKLLRKYQNLPVTDALKKRVWEELQHEKHLGNIKIPFKIVTRRDASRKFPEYIEIILDTKT